VTVGGQQAWQGAVRGAGRGAQKARYVWSRAGRGHPSRPDIDGWGRGPRGGVGSQDARCRTGFAPALGVYGRCLESFLLVPRSVLWTLAFKVTPTYIIRYTCVAIASRLGCGLRVLGFRPEIGSRLRCGCFQGLHVQQCGTCIVMNVLCVCFCVTVCVRVCVCACVRVCVCA
jgi:hypothetical protein